MKNYYVTASFTSQTTVFPTGSESFLCVCFKHISGTNTLHPTEMGALWENSSKLLHPFVAHKIKINRDSGTAKSEQIRCQLVCCIQEGLFRASHEPETCRCIEEARKREQNDPKPIEQR